MIGDSHSNEIDIESPPLGGADVAENAPKSTIIDERINYASKQDDESDGETEDSEERSKRIKTNPWRNFDFILGIVVKVAILCGSAFAIVQYMSAKSDARVAKTFEYITAYETGQMLIAREAIRREFRNYEQMFMEIPLPPDAFSKVILSFAEGEAGQPIQDELDRIIDFFKGVSLCLEQDLCDSDVTRRYFYPEAKYYWNNFEPYIQKRMSNNNPDFGRELRLFATQTFENN